MIHNSFLQILSTGDGSVLSRRQLKVMKNFNEQKVTSSGFQSLCVHPEAHTDEREKIVALAAVTRYVRLCNSVHVTVCACGRECLCVWL